MVPLLGQGLHGQVDGEVCRPAVGRLLQKAVPTISGRIRRRHDQDEDPFGRYKAAYDGMVNSR